MDLVIKDDNRQEFDVVAIPVLLQGNEKCECCSKVGAGIHETIDFDGSVSIINSNTGHNATPDFEIGDSVLVAIERKFIQKTRAEIALILSGFCKIDQDTSDAIRSGTRPIFCCDTCRDLFHELSAALLIDKDH